MKVLPLFVCSGLNSWNVQTSVTVHSALARLNRQPYVIGSGGAGGGAGRGRGGVAIARTMLLQGAREWAPGLKAVRGLWVDDDIEVRPDQAGKLADAIEESDRHNWNLVVPYRILDSMTGRLNWCVFHWTTHAPFTDQELSDFKDYDVIDGFAGMGFYYGYTPLEYHFSLGGPNDEGEDFRFFKENQIELRVLHLKTRHLKGAWV